MPNGRCPNTVPSPTPGPPFLQGRPLARLGGGKGEPPAASPRVPANGGGGVDGVDTTAWYAILAPAGTPASAIDVLANAVRDASRSSGYRQALLDMGASPFTATPAELGDMLRAEVVKWSELVKRGHLGGSLR